MEKVDTEVDVKAGDAPVKKGDAAVIEGDAAVSSGDAEVRSAVSDVDSLNTNLAKSQSETSEESLPELPDGILMMRNPVEALTPEELDMLEGLFKQMNTNEDGMLKPSELAAAMRKVGANVDEAILRRHLNLGEGEEGGLSQEEFIHMMAIQMKRKLSEDDVYLAFTTFDLNKDGFIDAEELRHAMTHIGFIMEPEEVEEMIRDADKDGDGKISFEEFRDKMLVFGTQQQTES